MGNDIYGHTHTYIHARTGYRHTSLTKQGGSVTVVAVFCADVSERIRKGNKCVVVSASGDLDFRAKLRLRTVRSYLFGGSTVQLVVH